MKLYNNDANTIVKELAQNKTIVDHIITDPPYNISKENNFNTMNNPRAGVDFGEWDKNFDLCSWVKPYANLIKKGGSMIVFCSYRYISFIINEMEKCDLTVKDILEWKKTNPMPRNINRRYVQDTEFAIWAVKNGDKWVFNKPDDKPYLRSTFTHSLVSGKEKTAHPTQKKLDLMKDIISIHTNENDVILDPFMGSGTTGVAAIQLNRKFIGIEMDENYFNVAKNRMQQHEI